MARLHKPRSGSLAFYPKKRASRQLQSFRTFSLEAQKEARPLAFLGYKAGMVHVIAKDEHKKSPSFGQEIVVPSTVIECPPLNVFGVRFYAIENNALTCKGEVRAEKLEKHFMKNLPKGQSKGKKGEEKKREERKRKTFADFEPMKNALAHVRLLVHSNPSQTSFGRKRPDVTEIHLTGTLEQQFEYARQKLGQEIRVSEVFKDHSWVDVKSVTIGKGTQGPVKRFGVKTARPKSDRQRHVGSLGPINPSTVAWTVARAGQLGYQTRTEYNKKIIKIGSPSDAPLFTPKAGFTNYGTLSGDFVLLSGSVPGPVKRAVSLREALRKPHHDRLALGEATFVSTQVGK
ncbi:MAG: 50S ribosomal protein L3 [Candidatus Diapherotrites archaeon]|nr:50S ribosomal protein L3 [Candidatus Diapherotrites archaeon]